jgi:hypothetical protein
MEIREKGSFDIKRYSSVSYAARSALILCVYRASKRSCIRASQVTIMFASIANFRAISSTLASTELVHLLNSVFSSFDHRIGEDRFTGRVYKVEVSLRGGFLFFFFRFIEEYAHFLIVFHLSFSFSSLSLSLFARF